MTQATSAFRCAIVLAGILTVWALGTTQAEGQTPPSSVVTTQLSKSTIRMGELVWLHLQATNPNTVPTLAPAELDPEAGFTRLTLRGPQGVRQYEPLVYAELPPPFFTPLAPGEGRSVSIPLFFDAQDWLLTQPGEYVIQVVVDLDESGASATIFDTLTVIQGTIGEGTAARSLFASYEAGMILSWEEGRYLEEGFSVLDRIASDDNSGIVGDYVNGILSIAVSHDRAYAPAEPERAQIYEGRVGRGNLETVDLGTYLGPKFRIERLIDASIDPQDPSVQPAIRGMMSGQGFTFGPVVNSVPGSVDRRVIELSELYRLDREHVARLLTALPDLQVRRIPR